MEDGVVQQNAMVSNPNQVWFPHLINVVNNPHGLTGKYKDKKFDFAGAVLADVVSNDEPIEGEILYYNSTQRNVVIIEVLEKKPAAGDWSGEFWKGVKPTWYRCLAQLEDLPKKEAE